MAAVFALVFLFALASVGLLFKVFVGDPSLVSLFAYGLFLALASGVFIGCFKLSRGWDSSH